MIWHCQAFNELTTHTLYAILKLRSDVFVVEQNCVFPDLDDIDTTPTPGGPDTLPTGAPTEPFPITLPQSSQTSRPTVSPTSPGTLPPTVAPTNEPTPFTTTIAFTTADELRAAVVSYATDPSPHTEVAQTYGYPIGSW